MITAKEARLICEANGSEAAQVIEKIEEQIKTCAENGKDYCHFIIAPDQFYYTRENKKIMMYEAVAKYLKSIKYDVKINKSSKFSVDYVSSIDIIW